MADNDAISVHSASPSRSRSRSRGRVVRGSAELGELDPIFKQQRSFENGLPPNIIDQIEKAWAQELRGEAAADDRPEEFGERYKLHAVHQLMHEFRKVPVPYIKSVFLRHGRYMAARSELEANPDQHTLKSKRPSRPAPPCEVPWNLVREQSLQRLGRDASLIEDALQERRKERKTRIAHLKAIGGLSTCGCCFDDEVLPEEELHCDSSCSHTFCFSCVKMAALTFFGSGLFAQNFAGGLNNSSASSSSTGSSSSSASAANTPPPDVSLSILRCMHTSGCSGKFSDADLALALPPKMYARYSRRSAALNSAASGLKDLVTCPGCDYMVEMNDENDDVVQCQDPDCGKVTCRWCGKNDHRPLKCDEVEENGESKIRTFVEEKLGDSIMRRCPNPRCRKPYEKTEGCNHMRCPCGTHSCYLCGETINKARPYDHYVDGSRGGGRNNKKSQCTVYGTPEWALLSEAKAKKEANKALDEYLKQNPDLQDLVNKPAVKRKLDVLLGPENQRRQKPRSDKSLMDSCIIL